MYQRSLWTNAFTAQIPLYIYLQRINQIKLFNSNKDVATVAAYHYQFLRLLVKNDNSHNNSEPDHFLVFINL
jgi:hypothetical protein